MESSPRLCRFRYRSVDDEKIESFSDNSRWRGSYFFGPTGSGTGTGISGIGMTSGAVGTLSAALIEMGAQSQLSKTPVAFFSFTIARAYLTCEIGRAHV